MIRRLFRGNPRRALIDGLHQSIVTASRNPELYERLGVPDTVGGRFETLALHLTLVLRRLRGLPPPAGEAAQDLVDAFFRQLDASLREMGVGDFGVPKRMKRLAQVFYERARAYDGALDSGDADALAEALRRNVYEGTRPGAGLARYAVASEAALGALELDALLTQGPGFPQPDRFRDEGTP